MATDLSSEILSASSAAQRAGLHNISFLEMDAEDLKLANASFDVVTNARIDVLSERRASDRRIASRAVKAVDEALQPHWSEGRLRLVATSLCASGVKP